MADSPGWGLRALALQTDPAQMWMARSAYAPVFGFVMDTLLDAGGWFSVVTFSDGTTSLYTSGSFGVIGAGGHEAVRAASGDLLALVRDGLACFEATADTALPGPGRVALRALTITGQRVVTAPERDLGEDRHPASAVFHAAHRVVTAVRTATPA